MKPYPIQARPLVQILFLLVLVFIGLKFYLFVSCVEKGVMPDFERPAGVEAFLPIGALVGLKHLLYTGTINRIHPSGLVLFLMIIFTAVFAKKGFCSWICPVGTLSEFLYRGHTLLFQKHFKMPAFADVLLRALKYLIAGFFIYQIFYKMPIDGIEQFIQSPYNRFADIHMLKFFTRMSTVTFIALGWILFFSGGITLAIMSDTWQNEIPTQAYVNYAVSMNREVNSIDRIDGIDPEKMQKMILMMKRLQEQKAGMQDSQQGKGD